MKRWRLSIGISLVLVLVASLTASLLVTGCAPGAGPEEPDRRGPAPVCRAPQPAQFAGGHPQNSGAGD